jgi:hypothetical protein
MNAIAPLASAVSADVEKATALFNESITYLRLASDHAKFIRNYFDPTQEQLFRTADTLAASLDQLRSEICALSEPAQPQAVFTLVQRAAPVVQQLITFKNLVSALIRSCQTQQLLPAPFVDHLRREADFFLGIVSHVLGGETPTRQTLDLPGPPQERVATIARKLIDVVPLPQAVAADFAYTEFWGKHHMEHADVLTMFLRPQQTDLITQASRFRDQFGALLLEATVVERQPSLALIDELDRNTLSLSLNWRKFLITTEEAQRNCSLQANFPQRLTEHIRIETDILLEAVGRAARRRITAGGAPIISTSGVTYQSLTPKQISCS